MNGILYIVATPIGNLEDITLRAIKILESVDLIAAESIEHSKKLLNAHCIKTEMTTYHDHNKNFKADKLIGLLEIGKKIALITDAGTPCISDPGYLLIKKARDLNITVIPVPGASAVVTALSVSGFATDKYRFIGFLPHTAEKKTKIIDQIIKENLTTIFFEAPSRIISTLKIFKELYQDSNLFIARELTKIHESFFRGKPDELIQKLESSFSGSDRIKGEMTVIYGKNDSPKDLSEAEIDNLIQEELDDNPDIKTKDLALIISEKYSIPKNVVYKRALYIKEVQ